jgi:O-antigen/teichoic acid export membrane protein
LKKETSFKSIFRVFTSNLFKFLSSLIIIFILPNFLGIENYGYYRLFLLYLSYLGIFHFGFIDGIYLKYGGKDLESLDQKKFRTYFYFFFILQILVLFLLFIYGILFLSGHRFLIFIFVIFNLIPINITTYFQFISQITFRFNEYSLRIYLFSILNLIAVILILLLNLTNYLFIVIFSTVINYYLFSLYLITYRLFIFGDKIKISLLFNDIYNLFRIGFPLLLSNIVSIILLTLDKIFVELYFEISSFSIYSFAFSILTLINLILSSISTVLYPIFKSFDKKVLSSIYSSLSLIINFLVFFGLFIYFPVYFLLPIFLPGYIDSLPIIRIALPGLVFTSSINTLTHNFYKVFNRNKEFLFIGIIAIFSLLLFIIFSYKFQPKIEYIAYSSLIGFGIWYILTHEYLKRKYNISYYKNFFYSLLFIFAFLILTSTNSIFLSGSVYLIICISFSVIEFKNIRNAITYIKH